MADERREIEINVKTNADEAAKKTNELGDALDKVEGSSKKTAKAVSENGGAMAILNTLTGGYAQVLKDAYEASDLFSDGMGKMLKSVKSFSTGAKAALISTGIGALVVLVGTLVAYWDDLKGLVSGVNSEMKKQSKLADDSAKAEEKKLNTLNGQDNILKMQGKTEKEILQMKSKQTDETITALEAQLQQQEAVKKAQIEASQRNKDILSGTLKFISTPITLLLRGIDEIGKAFGKDFGLSNVFDNLANLVFDPKEVASEADKTIEETKNKLDALKNQRAGYQLSIQNIDKEAAQKAKEANDEALKKEKERLEALLKERLDWEKRLSDEVEDIQDKTEEQKLARQRERAEEEIKLLKKKGIDTLEIERLNTEKFDLLEKELANRRSEEKRLENERLVNEFISNKDLELEARYEKLEEELEFLEEEKEAKLLSEEDYNKRKEELSNFRKNLDEEEAENSRILEEAKQAVREQGLSNVENIGKNLQVLAGKNKAVQKAGLVVEGAVGLANIVSSTMQANAKAVAAFPLTGGQPFTTINTISGALSAAAQIKAVSEGLKAVGGGSAGTAPSFAGAGGGATPPSVAFNNSAENQIGQSVAKTQADNPPIMVNVLESDITTAQNNVNVLESENTFG